MTIRNLIPLLLMAALLALIVAPFSSAVHAQERGLGVSLDARAELNVSDDDSASTTDEEEDDDSSSENRGRGDEMRASARADAEASTTDSDHARGRGEEHRSAVATFVRSLLSIADRDGGIGVQVREVARSQNDAASTTAEAVAKVEARSKLATLLLGTDWKSIGVLKREIRRAESDIERLEALLDETTDASVRAELEAQIDALVDTKTDIEVFVEENESTFSLFGWFTKLFVSASTDDSSESEDDTASTTEE